MSRTLSKQAAFRITMLIVGGSVLLSIPPPARIGLTDFRPYWSSSSLLACGQDFSNPSRMDYIERTLTGWNEPFTMHAWFAPTGNLLLLPYTFFPFTRAAYLWLLTNIVVVFASALLVWHNTRKQIWIPLIAAFGFSMTLLSFMVGQVNTVVVFGLALFLFLSDSRHDLAAGSSLVLTTIKPHLVILTLPLILLDASWRKQWPVLVGFAGALLGCTLALFVLYPAWPISFWQLATSGMSTIRETPTLTGLLVAAGEYRWGKWIWLVGLPLAIAVWWQRKKEWDRRALIDLSILGGIIVSPLGWSYDQVILLIPLWHVLEWAANGLLERKDVIAVALTLIITNAITFYERILSPSEVWFFWVPWVVATVYLFARQRRQATLEVSAGTAAAATSGQSGSDNGSGG